VISQQIKTAVGGLLHDIGKIVYRAGDSIQAHPVSGSALMAEFIDDADILDCIRYHHLRDIPKSLRPDAPAHLIYIADNISAGTDRRDAEAPESSGFDRFIPRYSVFNLLNGNRGKWKHAVREISGRMEIPSEDMAVSTPDYAHLLRKFIEEMKGISIQSEYISSLLEVMEGCFSNVPSSTNVKEIPDISLFDHAKLTAAYASCLLLDAEAEGIDDYAEWIYGKEARLYERELFLLASIDISGIQPFIFDIASEGALKSLRARSFYLGLLMENTVDELVEAVGVSRANVLYTGGGHAYLLFPNTRAARGVVAQSIEAINLALRGIYGTKLFFALGMQETSAAVLMGKRTPEAYAGVFRSLSSQIARNKLCRWRARDIQVLNAENAAETGRECKICGSTMDGSEDGICPACEAFPSVSKDLLRKDVVFAILSDASSLSLPLFSRAGTRQYLSVLSDQDARDLMKEFPGKVIRLYGKNRLMAGERLSTKLWMGDFTARNADGSIMTTEDMAKTVVGINRIAVLRADVDNLGAAFTSGFPGEYLTISRTATFSRSLSLFFKHYINDILEHPSFQLRRQTHCGVLTIVYSGGDDVFIIGAWYDVFAAALDLERALSQYACGSLTMSAGIAVFDARHPITSMARVAGELEDAAKKHVHAKGRKNSVALFGFDAEGTDLVCRHLYSWEDFRKKVVEEKLAALDGFFSAQQDFGGSFLYKLLALLRASGENRLNLARLAYLLARREPGEKASEEAKAAYARFSRDVYGWALNPEDRKQLITALMIYVYTQREKKED